MGPNKSLFHTSLLGLNNNTMKYETKRSSLLLLVVVVLSALISPTDGELQLKSKSILCADAKCESLYGKGHTITKYPSPDKDVLSFKKDSPVKIFGKTEDNQYMFVEINENRGFVPAKHILEDAIINPSLTFNVDFNKNQPNTSEESLSDSSSAETPVLTTPPSNLINDQPDAPFVYTSKSATVIEGTTFYEDILKTATPSPTYQSQSATTKTVTIEANFAEKELNQQNVALDGSAIVSGDNEPKVNLSGEGRADNVESPSESGLFDKDSVIQDKALSTDEKEDVVVEVVDDNKTENVESQNVSSDLVPKDASIVASQANVSEQVQNELTPETNDPKSNASETAQAETLSAFNFESAVKNDPIQNDLSDVPSGENVALPEESKQSVETESNVNSLDVESKVEPVLNEQTNESNEGVLNQIIGANETEQSSSEVDNSAVDEQVNSVPLDINNNDSLNEPPKDNFVQPSTSDDSVVVAASNVESETKVESDSKSQKSRPNQSETASNQSDPPSETIELNSDDKTHEDLLQSKQESPDASNIQQPSEPLLLVPQQLSPNEQLNFASEQQANPNLFQTPDPINPAFNSLPTTGQESNNLNQQQQPVLSSFPTNPEPGRHLHRLKVPRYARSSGSNPTEQIIPQHPPQQPVVQNNLQVDSNLSPLADSHVHSLPNAIPSPDNSVPSPANIHSHQHHINTPPVPSNVVSNQPVQPPSPELYEPVVGGGNIHVDAKIIPNQNEQFNWNKPQDNVPTNGVNSNSNSNNNNSPSFPASDNLENYSSTDNASRHGASRKLLAEKLFGGVIRDIIPDEVELFFESFGIPGHVFLFTSLVAFFWCSAKVVLSFWNSSRKERELRDINCQIQRKIYFFEAEKDKLKGEAKVAKEKLENHERDLHIAEKRKSKLEIENEQMKNELQMLRNENTVLRNAADKTPEISSKLNSTLSDFENLKRENQDLEKKIDELEDEIALYKESIKDNEKLNDSQNEKVKNINEKLKELSKENDNLKDSLNDAEQNFTIVQSENHSLKAQLSTLNEEMRNVKDDMLSLQDKLNRLEEERVTHLTFLEESKAKIKELVEDLEIKKAELASMEALLSKLNKNMSKEPKYRRQTSNDLNGDLTDAINGDNLSDSNESPTSESFAVTKSEEEADRDLQDIVKLQLRLTNIELEKKQVEAKLVTVQKQLNDTQTQLDNLRTTNDKLKNETDLACKERTKAVTELEVLSKYYKEKELEYGKEIGVQRVKREQKEEDATSMASQLDVTLEENEILKKQLKSTKKELEETERRFKSQLNNLEKQSHENWIAARNAERKFEESKAEATALRQTLTFSVKSPPPADLSLTGFMDDTASSISSLPDGLNTSIQLPPPPPPPPLMMMNSLMPPMGGIPPPPLQPQMYGDLNDSGFWNPSAIAAAVSSSANTSLTNAYAMVDTSRSAIPMATSSSEPSSLVFVQAGQLPSYAQQPMVVQPTNQNIQQVSQQGQQQHQQQSVPNAYQQYTNSAQHHGYNQWEDLSRNTYSPALSQRSATATPLTNLPNSVAASAAQQAYAMQQQSGQQSTPQQYQQHQQYQQQHYGSSVQLNNNIDPSANNNGANPYSISSYQQSQQQQQYPQQASYQQQQQPVDPNNYSSGSATLNASQTHQIWTSGQPLPPNGDPNAYSAYPQHAQHHPNGSFGQVPTEANSRPASVHTQMV